MKFGIAEPPSLRYLRAAVGGEATTKKPMTTAAVVRGCYCWMEHVVAVAAVQYSSTAAAPVGVVVGVSGVLAGPNGDAGDGGGGGGCGKEQ